MKTEILFIFAIAMFLMYEFYGNNIMTKLHTYVGYARVAGGLGLLVWLYIMSKNDGSSNIAATEALSHFIDFTGAGKQTTGIVNTFSSHLRTNQNQKKRNVSQLLKKQVAADQSWKCGHCGSILDASYEVDHKIALYLGGTNSRDNLIALCRNCHGKKTVWERLNETKIQF